MATRYWVLGSGNWDATTTTNWSTSSGGLGGASAPTSADDVIFDANSNVGTTAFTVTVTGTTAAPATCADFSTGGAGGALDGAMTLAFGSAGLMSCFGSITLPVTNLSVTGSGTAELRWAATTSGKTIITNGVSLAALNAIRATGIGGAWTLGSALTAASVLIQSGTFNTANYNLTITNLQRTANTGTTVINLGSSSVSCSASTPINFTVTTGLTFNAGTSTITCSVASPIFVGGGLTFYNVSFTSTASSTITITGENTFNNYTTATVVGNTIKSNVLGANQTISGTLTLGATNSVTSRQSMLSDTTGTQRTVTLNGTLATLTDVDFRDIVAAGTVGTWSVTRLGNGLNNSNITFSAGKTVYWSLLAGGNWVSNAWATSSGGTPATANFPLAQDTVIIDNTGLTTGNTISYTIGFWVGTINASARSNAWTFNITAGSCQIYGNLTLSSATTMSGAGTIQFYNYGLTKVITSASVTWTQSFIFAAATGTVQLADALTTTSATTTILNVGTLDLNNQTYTCTLFNSSNSNTRSIAFGTGTIFVTGSATTIWSMTTATGFTLTGTPTVNFNYSGATGTRTVQHGTTGGTETNAITVNVTAGTDSFLNSGVCKNLNFTGFSGILASSTRTIYGNLTIPNTISSITNTGTWTFAATSGTQQITSNSNTLDFPLTFNGVGGKFQLQDNLTLGSTGTVILTNGSLDINSKTLTCNIFSSNNSNTRSILFGTGNITITGLPFTPIVGQRCTGTVFCNAVATYTGTMTPTIDNNLSTVYFYAMASNSANGSVTHNAGTSKTLQVSIFYTTT